MTILDDIFGDFSVKVSTSNHYAKINNKIKNLLSHQHPLLPRNAVAVFANEIGMSMVNGPWIAGGSVRKSYHNIPTNESDWDIFFRNGEQFMNAVDILKKYNISDVHHSDNAITFKYDNTVIQLIRNKFYNSPRDVISNFDFSVCQYLTDGYGYIVGEHTVQDHLDRRLRYLQPTLRKELISRILKYRIYGYYIDVELSNLIESSMTILEFNGNGSNEYEF